MKCVAMSLFYLSFLSMLSFADEKKPAKPEPITISVPSVLAEYDQETGKINYKKDAEPEQVAEIVMKEYIALSKQFQELQAKCGPQPAPLKKEEPKKKKGKEDVKPGLPGVPER